MDQRWNKGVLERKRNKELTWGSGLEADLFRTRSEGGVTKAIQIGNLSGIDQEWRRLLDCEGESYAGVEGRQN